RPRSPEGCRPRAGPYPPHTHAARRAAQDAGDAARPRWATTDRGASQGGQVTMSGRWVPGVLILLVLSLAGMRDVAWGQAPQIEGLEKLSPEERAIAERNLERWRSLSPEERARVLENYRHWKSMSPEERNAAKESFKRYRALPPDERARTRERFRQLPPEERERLREQYRGPRPHQGQERPR